MQKRQVGKVALAHFVLTIVFGLTALMLKLLVSMDSKMAFEVGLERGVLIFLQPQFWIVPQFADVESTFTNLLTDSPFLFWALLFFCLISIPLWSLCFGWLYVNVSNWLKHVFVFGRKAF